MLQNTVIAVVIAGVWLVGVTLLFLLRARFSQIWEALSQSVFRLLTAAIFIRLVPALILPVGAGYDIESFRLVGEAFLAGEDVYVAGSAGRHPYLPMQMYLVVLSYWASLKLSIPFVLVLKLPLIIADTLLVLLLVRTQAARGFGDKEARAVGLSYALNPVPLLVTAYHGQFDAVTLLLLLAGWYVWRFKQDAPLTGVWLGLAVLNKTWPVVMYPILFIRMKRWSDRFWLSLPVLLIPVAGVLFYGVLFSADYSVMLRRALLHVGNPGWWGLSAIAFVSAESVPLMQTLFDFMVANKRFILVTSLALGLWVTRRQAVLTALTTMLVLLFAITPGIGVQWMLWIIPFALLEGDEYWYRLYSIGGALFLIIQNFGLHLYPFAQLWFGDELGFTLIRLGSVPAWIIVTLWSVKRVRSAVATQG